jgi:hypothetical protein
MANAGTLATTGLLRILQAPAGLNENLAAVAQLQGITLAPIGVRQIFAQNVAQAVVEKSVDLQYPSLFVYCEKISNDLREKFRTFSGKASLTIEVRVSQDRIEGLESLLQSYVDVVTRILDQNRGDWGNGMFYTGGYQAVFGQMTHGGRNFIETGKITLDVAVSID